MDSSPTISNIHVSQINGCANKKKQAQLCQKCDKVFSGPSEIFALNACWQINGIQILFWNILRAVGDIDELPDSGSVTVLSDGMPACEPVFHSMQRCDAEFTWLWRLQLPVLLLTKHSVCSTLCQLSSVVCWMWSVIGHESTATYLSAGVPAGQHFTPVCPPVWALVAVSSFLKCFRSTEMKNSV